MKPKYRPFHSAAGSTLANVVTVSFAMIGSSFASLWTGTAADNNWDNLSNWNSNPSGGVGEVDTLTNIPIVTGNNTLIPNDLKIAAATGTTGRVDMRSGTFTINYWTFVGDWNGSGTLNIADTTTTGGKYTDFGIGTASYDANNNNNANFMVGLYQSTGVVNMNTSGSLDASDIRLNPNGQGGSGTFNLDNGNVNLAGNFEAGSDFWGANVTGSGILRMNGGTITTGNEFWIGASGIGTGTMSGGTINSGAWFVVGRNNGANGTFTMSDGTVNAATTTVGSFAVVGAFAGSQGTLNVEGGLFQTGGDRKMLIGENGTGTLNVSGTGHVLVNNNVTGDGFRLGLNAGSSGTVNLNGGTLEVAYVAKGTGNGTFNFNGGTLKVGSNHSGSNPLMAGLTTATVLTGGAVIDTNIASNVVISQALLNGGGAGGLTKSGTGTLQLNGVNTYTGTTTVSQGSLGGTGTIAGPVSVQSGAGLNLVNGSSSGTLTLQNGLALSDGNLLTFEVGGGTSDKIAITAGTYTPPTNTVDVDVQVVGSTGLGVRKLITGAPDIKVEDFNLVTAPPLGFDFALQVTGNDLELNITSVSPATAYWKGGVNGSWSAPDSGGNFNWAQDDTGASSTVTKPGTPTDVVFSSTGAGNESTTLDEDFTINSLTFDASAGGVVIAASGLEELTVAAGITNNAPKGQAINTTLTLSGSQTINAATDDITFGSDVYVTGSALTVTGAASTHVAGNVVSSATSFTKTGEGTLNLGNGFSGSGALRVNGGTLNLAGATSPGGDIEVGKGAGVTGALHITSTGGVSMPGKWFFTGRDLGTGTVTVDGGTLSADSVRIATSAWTGATTTGTLNIINGGTVTTTGATVANDAAGWGELNQGTLNVVGGTLNSENDMVGSIGGAAGALGQINIGTGGVVNLASTTERWLLVNQYDSARGQVNVNGGTLNLNANTDIRFSTNGGVGISSLSITGGAINGGTGSVVDLNWGGGAVDNTVNLNGGTLTIGQVIARTTSGSRVFNFNGGTLKAAGSTANFFDAGVASAANVRNGGAVFHTAGNDVTIAQTLAHSGIGGDAAIDGGLTKNGAGTLTLTGANSYTGSTTVNGGALAVNGGSLPDSGTLVINTGAVVNVTGTETVGALYFGGVLQANGTWGATGSGAAHIDDVHFTGTGVISAGAAGYSSWASLNGATGQTVDQDHDNDGVDNGIEYFIGGPNGNTTGFTAMPSPAGGTVTWTMGAGYTGIYGTDYEVQSSTDLTTWTQVPEGTGDNTVTISVGSSVVYDMPSGGKSFVRLVVHE